MTEARRKWWLRTVAAVIGGGGTLTGAWVGFSRSTAAEQNPPAMQTSEPPIAAPQLLPPEPFERPRGIDVMPVAATAPTAPVALPPVVPAVPVIPAAGPEMGLQPPPSIPLPPPPATLPVPVPSAPAIPEVAPVIPVAAPFPPAPTAPAIPVPAPTATPKPVAVPPLPAIETPKLPAVPTVEKPKTPPATAPDLGVPAVPVATPTKPKLPETPVTPALPAVPDFGAPSAPAALTPPPLPAKVAEPVVPSLPAKPNSDLPTQNEGINVKSVKVGEKSAPVTPIVPMVPALDPVKVPETVKLPEPVKIPEPVKSDVGFQIPVSPVKPILPEPPAVAPKTVEPPLVTTPGDNTMIPLSKSAAAAVLGGMLLAPMQPAQAVVPVVPTPAKAVTAVTPVQADDKADKTEVADLKKQVEESNRKLAAIQEQLRVLTEAIAGKKDDKGFAIESDRGIVADLKEFKNRLAQIEKDLANYKSQSQSLRPTNPSATTNPIVDPKAGKGTIRVVNEYPVQISIIVNGMSYRIAPSKTLDVDVTAGDFSYQLLESGAAMTKSVIKEKETVTLRIK